MKEINTDVIVIGAGLTGLTTSYFLNKKGKKFITLDKNEHIGGVISTKSENGFIYEEGPNTGVIGNTAVVELFDELSDLCELEVPDGNVNKRYILKNGRWHHLPMGLLDAVSTPLFTLNDKFRVLFEPFRSKGKDPHENLAHFVKRRLGKSFLDYAIDPFILGVYAGDPDYLIPKYALPKLYDLEQKYGSLIRGAIGKKFEPKNELEKRVSKKVFSFKKGMSSLTNALYTKAGERNFITGISDLKISKSDRGYTARFINNKGEEIIINSEKLISTIGAYSIKDILTFIEPDMLINTQNLLYTKVWEVSLGFNKWEGIALDGFGGLIPSKEKRDILGILFMSSLFLGRAPEGGALLTVFAGGARRNDINELSEFELAAVIEKECMNLLSLKEFSPDLFKIVIHNQAIPQYGIDSGSRFNEISRLEKMHPGLIIGGNLRNGIGMADRIQQGKDLASAV